MKKLILFLFLIFCFQVASDASNITQEKIPVYGKYKITVFNSPRGDIKGILKVWKDERGINRANFEVNGEVSEFENVKISKNDISFYYYDDDNIKPSSASDEEGEEWELKVDGDKISGKAAYMYHVSGYRIKGN